MACPNDVYHPPYHLGGQDNIRIIRAQIAQKQHTTPYVCPTSVFRTVRTDIETFPYQRSFRGQIDASHAVVWGREAGYSPIITDIPSPPLGNAPPVTELSTLCFQYPCSTILPCNPVNPRVFAPTDQCIYISP